MSTSRLDQLALTHGISLAYADASGELHQASEAAKRGLLAALQVPIDESNGSAQAFPIAGETPSRRTKFEGPKAYLPGWLEHERTWGVTCQLYSIRSDRNGGIGDFEDLARLAELLGQRGADFLGVNPMHALFLSDAGRFSPYSPSSRRFLAPIYIATDLLGVDASSGNPRGGLGHDDELIDYADVLARKRGVLEAAFDAFRTTELGTRSKLHAAFVAFCEQQGRALEDFALFEALSEHYVAQRHGSGWLSWPTELRKRDSAAVSEFARAYRDRILFHAWLQWIADRQLAEAQRRAIAAGMRIGLYLDIAVGVAPDGADTWCAPDEVLGAARIGAPPDAFNVLGQDWGLAPLSPRALSEGKRATFCAVMESATRHAGAVRLDHAMALTRLYLIPESHGSRDGAYVAYPLDELLDIIAEVSVRHRVIIIGEDLGTVPEGFREAMRARAIQGYRVLIFERTSTGFRPAATYDRDALACIGTHDLPTLRAWWCGRDIEDRERLGIYSKAQGEAARVSRISERRELIALLDAEGLFTDTGQLPSQVDDIAIPIHRFLARTPCRLVAVQLEDLIGFDGTMNIPGTIDEHPNWRQRLPVALEEMSGFPQFESTCAAMRQERPRKR